MAEIKCPMCSKPNPAELDVCQFCGARLKPLTDELARSQPPIHPGEEPTEKDTSELESALPEWLRDVRQQARESSEGEPEQAPAEEEEASPPQPSEEESEEVTDLLAGLQSHAEDDEEIPDWLTNLRGDAGGVPSEETSTEEDGLAALKSMLGEETPEPQESEASPLPGWISNLGEEQAEEQVEEEPAQTDAQPTASEADFEWGADYETDSDSQAGSAEEAAPIDTELPNWLKGADEETQSETESDLPDWIASEEPAETPPALESKESVEISPQPEESQPAAEGDTPDWLASLGEESAEATPPQEADQPALEGEGATPDWLASLDEESAESVPQQDVEQPISEGEMPDWLESLGEEPTETTPQEEVSTPVEGNMPDWLASLGEEGIPVSSEEAVPGGTGEETSEPAIEGETPDWLASMGEGTTELEPPSEDADWPSVTTEESVKEEEAPTAFVDAEGESASTDDVDALFSEEMPDWLTDAATQVEEPPPGIPASEQDEDLRPAELPSWVQAMRPVEDVISETDEADADQPVEEQGPLAGLRGVLPAVPGVGPTSVPKAYSIKLQASEDQQSSAAMLEQMLAAEIRPKPITTQPVMLSQRFLRWIIAIVLLLVVGGTVFTGMQINPLPLGVSPDTKTFLDYVQVSLPSDAPVLLIFDYDPALAGELEAAAAPLVDYMVLQKAPRLSLISSTPTGSGLAEQFMRLENTQASQYYQAGQQFINLGYLPGGAAGVLGFAENPVTTKPVSINGNNPWETPVLQGVTQLSDFAVMILLTDNVETARIWIEQTETARGDTRFLVISSAQSGPMILPYLQSGQVNVMLSGLDGGAPIEQFNGGRPGTARRYWDAYGFGLLAALVMISLGSLWSLISGLRERRREQGEV
jgi:hypothetical protein